MGTSPGLVVMGDGSCSRGGGFESQCCILGGQLWKKRPGLAHLENSTVRSLVPVLNAVVRAIGRQDELRPGVVATVSLDGRCARDLRTTPAAKTKRNSSTCH